MNPGRARLLDQYRPLGRSDLKAAIEAALRDLERLAGQPYAARKATLDHLTVLMEVWTTRENVRIFRTGTTLVHLDVCGDITIRRIQRPRVQRTRRFKPSGE